MVPEAHDVLLCHFDLVAEYLPFAQVVAADLDARVSFVPFEFETENEVGGLLFAVDKPVFLFCLSGAVDDSVFYLPRARLAVPTSEVFSVEDCFEAGLMSA